MVDMRHKKGGHIVPMSKSDAWEMADLEEFWFEHKADADEYLEHKKREAKREKS